MPVIPPIPYSEIRGALNTGDLFFFHGTSSAAVLIENLEEAVGWPPYSHVGMVIKDGEDLYLWDAPGNGGNRFPDPYASDPDNRIHGKPVHDGCRVAALDDILGYYATLVDQPFTLRQLAPAASQDSFVALRRFINRVDGQPFPLGPGPRKYKELTGLMTNYAAGQEGASLHYGTYFCAQLAADSYMHMGLLAMEKYPPNGYSPAALGTDAGVGRLPLVNVALGAATPVEWDAQHGGGQPPPPD